MRLVETINRRGGVGPLVAIVEAHRMGTPHRAISIVVWNAARTKMLITRRAAAKATWPGFWSNAVCSHPLPREPYAAAARRRLFEELRIRGAVAPAFRLFYGPVRCPASGALEHELDHVFYIRVPERRRDPAESGGDLGLEVGGSQGFGGAAAGRGNHPVVRNDPGARALGPVGEGARQPQSQWPRFPNPPRTQSAVFCGRLSAAGRLERWAPALLLAGAAGLFLSRLGGAGLYDLDEGVYAEISREMLVLRDWLTPHLDFIAYLEKPPLLFWLNSLSFKLLGQSEFSARLPTALAAVAGVGLVIGIGRQLWSARAGLAAGAVLATSFGYFIFGRMVLPDMLFAVLLTGAFWGFSRALTDAAAPRAVVLAGYAAMAGAVLAKGVIGLIFPVLVVGLFLLATRDWRLLRRLELAAGRRPVPAAGGALARPHGPGASRLPAVLLPERASRAVPRTPAAAEFCLAARGDLPGRDPGMVLPLEPFPAGRAAPLLAPQPVRIGLSGAPCWS